MWGQVHRDEEEFRSCIHRWEGVWDWISYTGGKEYRAGIQWLKRVGLVYSGGKEYVGGEKYWAGVQLWE